MTAAFLFEFVGYWVLVWPAAVFAFDTGVTDPVDAWCFGAVWPITLPALTLIRLWRVIDR